MVRTGLRTIQGLVMILRFLVPWVVRGAGFTVFLVCMTVASTWVGIPNAVSRIANHWLDTAVRMGFPTRYSATLFYLLCAVATPIIVAGWILFAYLTVWLVNGVVHH